MFAGIHARFRNAISVVALVAIAGLAQATTYTLTNIPTLDQTGNGGSIYAQAINASGLVTGYYRVTLPNTGKISLAFSAQLTGSTLTTTYLGYLPPYPGAPTALSPTNIEYPALLSWGIGVNSAGTIVGSGNSYDFGYGTVVEDSTGAGGFTNIGNLILGDDECPDCLIFGSAISDAGTVVGASITELDPAHPENRDRRIHAFVYTPAGGMQDLMLLDGNNGAAYGVNPAGNAIVGFASQFTDGGVGSQDSAAPTNKAACVWRLSNGVWTKSSLGISVQSVAFGINNAGQIVGTNGNAFLRQPDGTIVQLSGGPSGSLKNPFVELNRTDGNIVNASLQANSVATAINSSGQIVGYTGYPSKRAFVASVDSNNVVTLTDLNNLVPDNMGWTLKEATAINDSGQIVGYGTTSDGLTSAFVLTPANQPGICCRGATCSTTVPQSGCVGANSVFVPAASASCNASGNAKTPCCYADFDKTGGVSVNDIFAFLRSWFARNPMAVFGGNGSAGTPTVNDIFAFLRAWFAKGC